MDMFPIKSVDPLREFPVFAEIPSPPKTLFMRGSLEKMRGTKLLTIVGSRNCSPYGIEACKKIISGLKGKPITIVSGLAKGIDTIAHEEALRNGINTIAFPGSGLNWNVLYPRVNSNLAGDILNKGGALVSEYEHDMRAAPWTFPRRNRLEAGISDMTLVIEAEHASGTLITARLAAEYNRIVGAVPGSIHSPTSYGANWLLKVGAVPVTGPEDILKELSISHINGAREYILNEEELRVLHALIIPKNRLQIMEELSLPKWRADFVLSTLEIKELVQEKLGLFVRLIDP